MKYLKFLSIFLLAAGFAVHGDTVHLKNGARHEGRVIKSTRAYIRLKRADGKIMLIRRRHIRSIKRGSIARKQAASPYRVIAVLKNGKKIEGQPLAGSHRNLRIRTERGRIQTIPRRSIRFLLHRPGNVFFQVKGEVPRKTLSGGVGGGPGGPPRAGTDDAKTCGANFGQEGLGHSTTRTPLDSLYAFSHAHRDALDRAAGRCPSRCPAVRVQKDVVQPNCRNLPGRTGVWCQVWDTFQCKP